MTPIYVNITLDQQYYVYFGLVILLIIKTKKVVTYFQISLNFAAGVS